jgi:hypothetical protein
MARLLEQTNQLPLALQLLHLQPLMEQLEVQQLWMFLDLLERHCQQAFK